MSQVATDRRYSETRGRLALIVLALAPVVGIAWITVLAFFAIELVRRFL